MCPRTEPDNQCREYSDIQHFINHVLPSTESRLPFEVLICRRPEIVHACDAAHLLRTVNAAVSEGITSIAAVHDSFGCLPPRATRFHKIIRNELVRMYEEHDVLREVRDQACADLDGRNH
jgi:hypothetical protein